MSLRNELFVQGLNFDAELPIDPDSYLDRLPVIQALRQLPDGLHFNQPVTFLVGENGAGKSTLLEAIAVHEGFNAEGGTKNFNFKTKSTHSAFHDHIRIRRSFHRPRDGFFLRAESFYNVATELEELNEIQPIYQYYGGKSLHQQSHGESFLNLILNRFGGDGLYILDEPEAALSPMKQLTLLAAIDKLVKADSQFIIATHSPMLLTYPGADIRWLDKNKINKVLYYQTEHFQLMKDFLAAPERYFKHLT